MNKLLVFILATTAISPAHAFWGVGDITFDPTTYGEVSALYKQTTELYETAKKQLDGLASIEKTIREAQQAYESLANTDLKQVVKGLKPDKDSGKSIGALRAELERVGNGMGQNAGYIRFQLSRITQLENLELLKKASAANTEQATGKMNAATAERITAQSAATLASLAAAEEQRRVQEDYAHAAAAKAVVDNLNNSNKVYEAMGK
jgi:DNA-binding ferritin-like protein